MRSARLAPARLLSYATCIVAVVAVVVVVVIVGCTTSASYVCGSVVVVVVAWTIAANVQQCRYTHTHLRCVFVGALISFTFMRAQKPPPHRRHHGPDQERRAGPGASSGGCRMFRLTEHTDTNDTRKRALAEHHIRNIHIYERLSRRRARRRGQQQRRQRRRFSIVVDLGRCCRCRC